MYPREQRLRDYNKVLDSYEKGALSGLSICERLRKIVELPVGQLPPKSTAIYKEYPELASFKPKSCAEDAYGFNSDEERIDCLKRCVEMLDIKVGDKVVVTRKATKEELEEADHLHWAEAMDHWVGLECEVGMTLHNSKLQLNLGGHDWVFPECVLEKVSTSPSTNELNSSMNVEFKLGDTVQIIGNESHSSNKVGDIGVITETRDLDARVQVVNGPDSGNWSNLKDLKLKTVMKTVVNNVEIELTEEQVRLIESKQLPTSWEQAYAGARPQWYADSVGIVKKALTGVVKDQTNVTTEMRGKSVRAYCKLSVVVDALNKTQEPHSERRYTVEYSTRSSELITDYYSLDYLTNPLTLNTLELAEHLISHFKELLLDFYMIKN